MTQRSVSLAHLGLRLLGLAVLGKGGYDLMQKKKNKVMQQKAAAAATTEDS